ncbi:MAG TPA: amino acid permease [Steroidobacteraceae bacterium]|nr:amino acid permease [Steroidobacteraceae bacterium]
MTAAIEQHPAATGRPHELSRTLLPRHIAMITLGGVIGAGLFVGSSAAIAAAGPAALFSYVIAGSIVFIVMRMLGEMALTHPHVRSFSEFARAGLGNAGGFIAGWLYWYFWIVVVPIEAIAGAQILHLWFDLPVWQIGLALMAIMTAVNLLSARSYGEFEFWFSSIKVAAIIAFILVAAAYAFGFTAPQGPTWSNLTAHGGGFAPRGWVPVVAAVTTVFFSMVGPEITTVAAAESKDPEKAVVRMATSISWRILFFYVVSLFLIVSVVRWTDVVPGESPFTLALNVMGFGWGSAAMSFIILTAVLSCLNSAVYVCSRVLHVLADHGDAPRWLVEVNARRVPARSIWLASIAGVIGVVLAIVSPNAVFAFLVSSSGTVIVFVYLMTAVSQVRLRRRHPETETRVVRVWLFPWLSYATIAAMVAVLIAMALTPGLASQLWFSVLALAVATGAYFVRSR